jgi:hypothetical protein
LINGRDDYLQINAVQPFGWSVSVTTTTTGGTTKVGGNKGGYNVKPNTKAGLNIGSARQSTNYGTGVNGG